MFSDSTFSADLDFGALFSHIRSGLSSTGLLPPSSDFDWIVKLLEDLFLLLHDLVRATDLPAITIGVTHFVKHRFGSASLCSTFFENLPVPLKFFEGLRFTKQSASVSHDHLENLSQGFKQYRNSAVVQQLYKFWSYCVAFSVLEKIGVPFCATGFSRLEAARIKSQTSSMDVVECLLDTCVIVCRQGMQAYKSQDVSDFFHSPDTYCEWFDATERVLVRHERLGLCDQLPDDEKFSVGEFARELDSLIATGRKIEVVVASSLTDLKTKVVKTRLRQLLHVQTDFLKMSAGLKTRKAPFACVVYGPSGIGKTSVVSMLRVHFAKMVGLPLDEEYVYTVPAGAKYWNNFRSAMHTLILEEVGFRNPNATIGADESVDFLPQIVSNNAFSPPAADLPNKGNPLFVEGVFATTNIEYLNAKYYYSFPAAAQRRLRFQVIPQVKRAYRRSASDARLREGLEVTEGYADYWTYTVKEFVPDACEPKANAKLVTILKDVGLGRFLEWYNDAIHRHRQAQDVFSSYTNQLKDVTLCEHNNVPTKCRRCLAFRQQSEVVTVVGWFATVLMFFATLWQTCLLFRVGSMLDDFFDGVFHLKSSIRRFIFHCKHPFLWLSSRRWFWRHIGHRVQKSFGIPHFVILLGTIAVAGFGIKHFLRKVFKFHSQGNGLSSARPPTPRAYERENPWKKLDFPLVPVPLSDSSKCLKHVPKLIEKLEYNLVTFEFHFDGGYERVNALCIGGHHYITNNHAVPEHSTHLVVQRSFDTVGVTPNHRFAFNPSMVRRFPDRDIAIIELINLPPRRKLIGYFLEDDFEGSLEGMIYMRRDEFIMNPMRNVRFDEVDILGDGTCVPAYFGECEVSTADGDCGSPLIFRTAVGPAIAGLHAGAFVASDGKQHHHVSLRLTRSWLESVVNFDNMIEPGTVQIGAPTKPRELGPLHNKSPFRFIPQGVADVHGSFQGFRPEQKSNVMPTFLQDEMLKDGYPLTHTAPRLVRNWRPAFIAAEKLTSPASGFDSEILWKCARQYVKEVLEKLSDEEMQTVHVYDVKTAINGFPGITYVDALNKSTSMGLPYRGPKKKYIVDLPPDDIYQEPFTFEPEIMERIEALTACYKAGERGNPIFMACLKDEPVTFEKAAIGKVRVFSAAPVDYSVVVRQYFLSFVRLVQNNKFVFESAPGTVAQSREWGDIFQYLTSSSPEAADRMINGDFKFFDKDAPALVTQIAMWIMSQICAASGNYTDEDLLVQRGIAEDACFPLTDFFGTLVALLCSNPSGWPLTVILNGIVNSLYTRYAYYINNPNSEVHSFRRNVRLMTYGDDNIMSVKPGCDWFNHTSMQRALADCGITYTMADKDSESVPYLNIMDCDFLKRKWSWNSDLGGYMCPLDEKSIGKMLTVCVASKEVLPEAQMCSIMHSALSEYFNYGRERFNERRAFFQALVDKYDLSRHMPCDFPTFDILIERWRISSEALPLKSW